MPIYEYRCESCGHELEALQKISDPKLTTCPQCGAESLNKLVSASAFVLRGTGWYATDFKDKPKGAQSDNQDSGSKAADGKGDGKTESGSSDKSDTGKSDKDNSSSSGKKDSTGKETSKPAKKAAGES